MISGLDQSVINPIDQEKLSRLREAAGSGPVLILTHDNPDPDGLASGKALASLLNDTWQIRTKLWFSGMVARAENQAMLRLLTPQWKWVENLKKLEQFSAIALVDTQPGAGNNILPESIHPQIVLDHHHPIREGLGAVTYYDIRPEIGATVSLLYQHLESANMNPDPELATAMFYGLQTDTQGLARGASLTDQEVYIKLLNRIDREKLIQVEKAGLPRDYFRAFSQGLKASRVYDHVVVAYLGSIHRPDFVAEIADILIRLKEARAALCLGYHEDTLYFSLRTEPSGIDAGLLVQEIILPPGKAGGHGTIAGGQVKITGMDVDHLANLLTDQFLKTMKEKSEGQLLLGS